MTRRICYTYLVSKQPPLKEDTMLETVATPTATAAAIACAIDRAFHTSTIVSVTDSTVTVETIADPEEQRNLVAIVAAAIERRFSTCYADLAVDSYYACIQGADGSTAGLLIQAA